MRHLVLVLPELAALTPVDGGETIAGPGERELARARFSSVQRVRGGWRGWLARSLRFGELTAVDTASVVAASRAADVRGAWLATPLQLAAGMQTVHVPADGILPLEPDEAVAWCLDFSRVFGADGLELEPVSTTALLLRGLDAPGVLSVEPAMLVGRSLGSALPQGAQASRLRALMAELEMWLHEHPLNVARQHRARPAIGSLWLWGGGGPRCEAPLERAAEASVWDHLYADDPWVSVLAGLAGVPVSLPPEALGSDPWQGPDRVALVVSPAQLAAGAAPGSWAGLVDAVDRRYVRPALQALAAGTLDVVTLVAGDRAMRLGGSDRYRFWRPARAWARALAD